MSWQSSIRTLPDDFGCKKAILLLSAPSIGLLCISSNPSFINLFISISILSTSKAKWWTPSPRFSINLAIGLSGSVACRSSILLSPILKKDVFTDSELTNSVL